VSARIDRSVLDRARQTTRLCAIVSVLSVSALLSLATVARAAPAQGTIEEFPVGTIYRGELRALAPGPEQSLWLVQSSEYASEGFIERVTPAGVMTGFFLLPGIANPGDIAEGPDQDMWLTNDGYVILEHNDEMEEPNTIDRITPSGRITQYPIPNSATGPAPSYPYGPAGIAADNSGNMWFTDQRPSKNGTFIGRITTSGTVSEFPIPTGVGPDLPQSSLPLGIALGAEGDMWFTDQGQNAENRNFIGRIAPSGVITEFPVPTPESMPTAIALGADGNMWFTEPNVSKIGRITPEGVITEFPVPSVNDSLTGLTLAPDGNIWFTGNPSVDPFGLITPTGTVKTIMAHTSPLSIATGGDGNIWFTDPRPSPPEMLTTSFFGRLITPIAPTNVALPVVSGQPVERSLLTTSEGSWTHEPTAFGYQWQRCDTAGLNCENVSGATNSTYFLAAPDVNHTLRVVVVASTDGGSSPATSAPSPVIQSQAVSLQPPPSTQPPIAPISSPQLLGATLTWRFAWSSRNTFVTSLVAHGLTLGSFVEVVCHGKGCPFSHARLSAASTSARCRNHGCKSKLPVIHHGELNMTGLFKMKHLLPGARITVSLVEPEWIGRYFAFTVRRKHAPSVGVSCLAPDSPVVTAPC
jgi:virginiamycin B lyase